MHGRDRELCLELEPADGAPFSIVISREDAEWIDLREGDIVIVHTGWGDLFEQYPAQNATYNSGEPGIGKDAATWLISQKIVAVGSDSWAVEVIPG